MLTIWGARQRFCDGINRRGFLKIGAFGAGLTLADMLRARAQANGGGAAGARSSANKAAIMIYLPGGPPHMDMYDLKPEAPAEYRGEFRPIATNVPGVRICELMPLQAQIADKMALVRNMDFRQGPVGAHSPVLLYGGDLANPKTATFPAIGSSTS